VTQWLGTAAATPTTAGVPEVDITHINGAAQTATLDTIKAETVLIVEDTGTTIPGTIATAQADLDILTGADGAVIASGTQTFNMTGSITGNLSGSVGSVTGNVGGNVVGSVASVTGAINTAAGTITTLDALDTAQDTQHSTTQSAISGLSIPTAADNADAVWEEAIADHSGTAGSTAEQLAAAGAAGDPWATALPGSYTSGQAGKIVGDNINATVGSRATQTSVDDLPTNAELATALGTADDAVLTAIGDLPTNAELATALASADDAVLAQIVLVKAKTDSLTFTVAGQADVNVQYVNGVEVTGDGQTGTEWGPA
jgi:hypothetical protein